MQIRLEDDASDVLGKAARGHALSHTEIAKRANLPPAVVKAAFAGKEISDPSWRALAKVLELAPEALLSLAHRTYTPPPIPSVDMFVFTMPYNYSYAHSSRVNCFRVCFSEKTTNDFWHKITSEFFLVDTGPSEYFGFLAGSSLKNKNDFIPHKSHDSNKLYDYCSEELRHIFITHAHSDHSGGLGELLQKSNAEAFIPDGEKLPTQAIFKPYIRTVPPSAFPIKKKFDVKTFKPGTQWKLGALTLQSLPAAGHSPGQVAYFLSGLERPILFTGDSLFAGSMGGCSSHETFQQQWVATRALLDEFPGETIIAPGHGPLSTIEFERTNNPFFAERLS